MSLPQLEQTLRARTNSAAIDIVVVRAQVPTIVSAGNGGGGSTLETSQPAQQRLQSDSLLRVSLLQCYIADLSFASIREQAVSCNRHTVRRHLNPPAADGPGRPGLKSLGLGGPLTQFISHAESTVIKRSAPSFALVQASCGRFAGM